MKIDAVWLTILADLFVNLSAGWLGAVFVVPAASRKPRQIRLRLLTVNLFFAIIFLVMASRLKRLTAL